MQTRLQYNITPDVCGCDLPVATRYPGQLFSSRIGKNKDHFRTYLDYTWYGQSLHEPAKVEAPLFSTHDVGQTGRVQKETPRVCLSMNPTQILEPLKQDAAMMHNPEDFPRRCLDPSLLNSLRVWILLFFVCLVSFSNTIR